MWYNEAKNVLSENGKISDIHDDIKVNKIGSCYKKSLTYLIRL